MVKPVLIIRDVEKEGDGILYDAAEFVRFPDSHCENNYFMVLQSVSASNLECLSKAFPVGATSIYLLAVHVT